MTKNAAVNFGYHLPDVAAQFHVGVAAAAPRASRAGLPLCGSGPDNVWQAITATV